MDGMDPMKCMEGIQWNGGNRSRGMDGRDLIEWMMISNWNGWNGSNTMAVDFQREWIEWIQWNKCWLLEASWLIREQMIIRSSKHRKISLFSVVSYVTIINLKNK
ncbi:hypothetical protein CDAR_167681 [Caerostris darwini]|uniref:Uncharacterized protein n=1 Tax=Caerostris darwini TaxID=1538125 RepID=A0AAV4M8M2_9ARAC|nr:hypothetical protein CDAR_167681 [Caerostris darwini]